MNAEQQAKSDGIGERLVEIESEINKARAGMEAGTLDVQQGLLILATLASESTLLYTEALALHEEGVSWWELGFSGLMLFFSRGMVSKGPLVPVFNFLGGLLGAKK